MQLEMHFHLLRELQEFCVVYRHVASFLQSINSKMIVMAFLVNGGAQYMERRLFSFQKVAF